MSLETKFQPFRFRNDKVINVQIDVHVSNLTFLKLQKKKHLDFLNLFCKNRQRSNSKVHLEFFYLFFKNRQTFYYRTLICFKNLLNKNDHLFHRIELNFFSQCNAFLVTCLADKSNHPVKRPYLRHSR